MTSTANTTTSVPCPQCKRLVTVPEGFKVVLCPWCQSKVAAPVKVATK